MVDRVLTIADYDAELAKTLRNLFKRYPAETGAFERELERIALVLEANGIVLAMVTIVLGSDSRANGVGLRDAGMMLVRLFETGWSAEDAAARAARADAH